MARKDLISNEQVDEFLKENYGYNPKPEDFMLDLMQVAPMLLGIPMPMIRYRGVKKTQAVTLGKAMQKVEGVYHEPFVGSGSSLYRVGKEGKFSKAKASDANPKMIDFLQTIKESPQEVSRAFKAISSNLKKPGKALREDIPYLKEIWNEVKTGNLNKSDEAAANLVLGNYTQMYMPGQIPRFSPGNYIKPTTMANRIEEFGDILKNVTLEVADWSKSMKNIKPKDFVNLDTPYLGTKTYPGLKPTTAMDHRSMSNILKEMAEETSGVMYNSPLGATLFDWMETKPSGYLRGEEVVGSWGEGWEKPLLEDY